jgi:GNAT superfamily N-acetyltransferase
MQDHDHHIVVAESDGTIVSSCVLVVVPNLTHGQRPYALVENVVTDKAHRGRGYATECLLFAADLARKDGCYKIMLLTGSKEEATLRFTSGPASTGRTRRVLSIGSEWENPDNDCKGERNGL